MSRRNSSLRFQTGGSSRATQLPVGKKQRLTIERQAGDGRGIAFEGGRTWFVSGALAGEQVEARVLSARSQTVDARTERIILASSGRRTEPCVHAGQCGGCNLQHMQRADQLALKQRTLAEQLSRLGGIQPDEWAAPLSGAEFAYRRRARIAVRWDARARHLEVGFRAEASQAIVAIDQCPVLVQPLQPIFQALPALLRSLEKPQSLGHVELFSGSAEAMLLRHTAALSQADLSLLRAFCLEYGVQLWLQGEGEAQADDAQTELAFRLPPWDLQLSCRPGDFVQVNEAVNEAMIVQALDWLDVEPGARVLDLFCGLGNFALPLARQRAEVVAVEGVEGMVRRATANARNNGLENAHFFHADLSKPLAGQNWAQGDFAAVLLDPPRDGALEVVRGISGLGVRRLLYVSCNPTTLARDAAELARQGYRMRRAGILDMFPQTAHVEAMALFERPAV